MTDTVTGPIPVDELDADWMMRSCSWLPIKRHVLNPRCSQQKRMELEARVLLLTGEAARCFSVTVT
jgi:hypothetical protein